MLLLEELPEYSDVGSFGCSVTAGDPSVCISVRDCLADRSLSNNLSKSFSLLCRRQSAHMSNYGRDRVNIEEIVEGEQIDIDIVQQYEF